MKEPYIIIYNSFDSPKDEVLFIEAIASNFISKKGRDNMYIINSDKGLFAADIHKLLTSKLNIESDFLVVGLSNFYGTFNNDGIKWLKKEFPDINWLHEDS